MTQMQLEYQKLLETKRRNDQEIAESKAKERKTQMEWNVVAYQAQKELQQALLLAAQQGLIEMQISAMPYETAAHVASGIGSVVGGTGKLIAAL